MEKRKLNTHWNTNSWKDYKLLQQPMWPDESHYESIINILNEYPSLIFPDQINQLKYRLAQVHDGKAFLIQGGECAESFNEFSEESIKNVNLNIDVLNSDIHASSEYRAHLVKVMAKRAIKKIS